MWYEFIFLIMDKNIVNCLNMTQKIFDQFWLIIKYTDNLFNINCLLVFSN